MVSFGKLGSWYLLLYVSFVLVTIVLKPRAPGRLEATYRREVTAG